MSKYRAGFTIVELLIVIVVIGILAAITIVAFNGVQKKAQVGAVSAALSQVSKKLELYKVDNSTYPSTLTAAGIDTAGSTTYQFSVDTSTNPQTYCVTATNGTTSYKADSVNTSPVSGACAGHGVGGVDPITNLKTNPSVETDATGYGGVNGGIFTRDTPYAIDGSYGLHIAVPANGVSDAGVNLGAPSPLSAGDVRTYSVKIRATTAGTYKLSVQGTSNGLGAKLITLAAGQVGTLSYTQTVTTAGTVAVYVLRTVGTTTADFDIDSLIITSGATVYGYADGTTAGWKWNGTANASTSTGPPQ